MELDWSFEATSFDYIIYDGVWVENLTNTLKIYSIKIKVHKTFIIK